MLRCFLRLPRCEFSQLRSLDNREKPQTVPRDHAERAGLGLSAADERAGAVKAMGREAASAAYDAALIAAWRRPADEEADDGAPTPERPFLFDNAHDVSRAIDAIAERYPTEVSRRDDAPRHRTSCLHHSEELS